MAIVTKGVGPIGPATGLNHTSIDADVIILDSLALYPGGIDGGGGQDELRWNGNNGETLALDASLVSVELVDIGAGAGTSSAGVDGSDIRYSLTIKGNDGDNVLTGGRFNDTIIGGGGDDTVFGGGGANSLVGGSGDDVYVALENDNVVELPGGGTDTVVFYGTGVATTPANVEVLSLPDYVGTMGMIGGKESAEFEGNDSSNYIDAGAGDDTLYGYGGDDILVGGAGNDWLDGGRGADVMQGGAGDDTYSVGSFYDQVVESVGGGFDVVHSTLRSYTAPENVEGIVLDGAATQAIGNGLDNVLAGDVGPNWLAGLGGADTLRGGGGDDSLNGGSGNDSLDGGAGSDTAFFAGIRSLYVITPGGDTVTIIGPDGKDVLTGVEFAHFDDGDVTLQAPTVVSHLPPVLPAYADTALHGGDWQHTGGTTLTLRFSFMDAAPSYAASGESGGNFSPMTDDQKAAVREVFQTYAKVIDVDFVETADSAAVELRFGRNPQSGSSGYAYVPNAGQPLGLGNAQAGDVWLARDMDTVNVVAGGFTFETLIHEIGHALGLKHPFNDPPKIVDPTSLTSLGHGDQDTTQFTVMSYTDRPDLTVSVTTTATGRSAQGDYVSDATPMVFDIGVLQGIYGANSHTATGNDTYSFPDQPFFRTLWDTGGTDTIDASGFDRDQVIDLLPGHFSSVGVIGFQLDGVWQTHLPIWYDPKAFNKDHPEWFTPTYGTDNLSIAYGTVIENAVGGAGNDTLVGNDAANVLTGGTGADTFVFNGPGAADTVTDFAAGSDKLAFDHTVFGALGAAGPLATGEFQVGATAAETDDRLLYLAETGALFYDPDGTGPAAPTQVATFAGHPVLTAADFLVV